MHKIERGAHSTRFFFVVCGNQQKTLDLTEIFLLLRVQPPDFGRVRGFDSHFSAP